MEHMGRQKGLENIREDYGTYGKKEGFRENIRESNGIY